MVKGYCSICINMTYIYTRLLCCHRSLCEECYIRAIDTIRAREHIEGISCPCNMTHLLQLPKRRLGDLSKIRIRKRSKIVTRSMTREITSLRKETKNEAVIGRCPRCGFLVASTEVNCGHMTCAYCRFNFYIHDNTV